LRTLLFSLIGISAFAIVVALVAFFAIRAAIQRAEDRVIERYESTRRSERTSQMALASEAANQHQPDLDDGVTQEDFEAGCKDVLAQIAYRHREMRRPARRHGGV
jgi:hypothetical protein